MTTLLAVVLAAASLIAACTKRMPADWPLPELTLPPGAKIVKVYRDLATEDQWIITFDCAMSRPDAVKHIEQQLAPRDYRKMKRISEVTTTDIYYSSDGLVKVKLDDLRAIYAIEPTMKEPFNADYWLEICLFESPHLGLKLTEPLP